jgi:hypothetical protein
MSLWHDVRAQIIDWYVVAAERTEEWAQIGVRHYDRYGTHRRLAREFTNLGGEVHSILGRGEFPELAQNEAIAPILEEIRGLERELRDKDEEIAAIRRERETGAKAAAEGSKKKSKAEGEGTAAD